MNLSNIGTRPAQMEAKLHEDVIKIFPLKVVNKFYILLPISRTLYQKNPNKNRLKKFFEMLENFKT